MNMRNVLTIVYFVSTMYSFSGGLVHGVANYSSWKLISAEDFPVVHKYVDRRILAVYVPFFFLSIAVNIKQLDQVKSTELIGRLVKVHLYLRLIPGSLNMIVTALMMYQVLGAAS
jgi:hypothetical protein